MASLQRLLLFLVAIIPAEAASSQELFAAVRKDSRNDLAKALGQYVCDVYVIVILWFFKPNRQYLFICFCFQPMERPSMSGAQEVHLLVQSVLGTKNIVSWICRFARRLSRCDFWFDFLPLTWTPHVHSKSTLSPVRIRLVSAWDKEFICIKHVFLVII